MSGQKNQPETLRHIAATLRDQAALLDAHADVLEQGAGFVKATITMPAAGQPAPQCPTSLCSACRPDRPCLQACALCGRTGMTETSERDERERGRR